MLNLHVFVEDVYEARVAPNDANLGLGEMMRAVEARYRSLVLRLDTLPQDQVARAEAECFADFERVMRVAREAARRVVQIERLTHGLKRALEPPVHRRVKGVPPLLVLRFVSFYVCELRCEQINGLGMQRLLLE